MKLFSSFFRSKQSRPDEYEGAAAVIAAFVAGTANAWDWDDFTSIKKQDPYLESVRLKCVAIPEQFPSGKAREYCSPDGMTALRGLAKDLRAHATTPKNA